MVFWLCCLISILILIIAVLCSKIYLLKKSADEISDAFSDRVASDTNVLIDLSSRDKSMKNLANIINKELKKLQNDRLRYQQGDTELKNAVTNISHDLRTPLTSIRGYIKGVLDGVADTPEKKEMYLRTAYESTGEMNSLL